MTKLAKVLNAILIVCYLSCKTQEKSIAGKYQWTDDLKISSSEMILNKDGTFNYWFQAGDLNKINSSGKWRISGHSNKALLLNSDLQSENDVLKVEEIRSRKLSITTKRIMVYGADSKPVSAYIFINPMSQSALNFTDANYGNSIELSNVKLHKIAISYLGLGHQILFYNIKDSLANDIKIYIKINSLNSYKFFENNEWQIKNDKLVNKDTVLSKKIKRIYTKK